MRLAALGPADTFTLAELREADQPLPDVVRLDQAGDVRLTLPQPPGRAIDRDLLLPDGALLRAALSGVADEPAP